MVMFTMFSMMKKSMMKSKKKNFLPKSTRNLLLNRLKSKFLFSKANQKWKTMLLTTSKMTIWEKSAIFI